MGKRIKKEPRIIFKSLEEMRELVKEWKTRLFLEDWNIQVCLVNKDKMRLETSLGENSFCLVNHSSVIRILKLKEEDTYGEPQKIPQELTLIHELLHLKILLEDTNEEIDFEKKYYYNSQHALIEQIAKSLYMTKYSLTFDWFINENYYE